MKILNLYSGIGGNRKLWDKKHNVVAIEIDPNIARIYQDFFPDDKVIIADAHQYLLEHFKEYDFIWSSPPCPTHSRLRTLQKKIVYPDMKLYQEIILLKKWFKGKWIIENVMSYYEPLIQPIIIHRHFVWNNFTVYPREFPKFKTCKAKKERLVLSEELEFDLDKYKNIDKRLLLRNCVLPELGLHIFQEAFKKPKTLL